MSAHAIRAKILFVFIFFISFQPNAVAETGDLRVVAYVDREVITAGELKSLVENSLEGRELKNLFQGDDYAVRWRNLERQKLQELITRRLIVREARRRIPSISSEEVNERIATEIHLRNFEGRDDLRKFLRDSGVSWEEWIKQIEDAIYVEQYEGYMTRRQYLVGPGEVREFYRQHHAEKAVEHRSVDGFLRRVTFQQPEQARVNHLIIKPNLVGEHKITSLEQLSKVHVKMRLLVKQFESAKPRDIQSWLEEAKEKYPEVEVIYDEDQDYVKGSGALGSLDSLIFELPLGTWSSSELTVEPTRYQDIQTERWDFVQVIEVAPGRQLPLRQVRDQIASYLRLSIRDREMQILKEKLWKLSSVKIVEVG